MAFAVEQAWKAGIFVVAATGNSGYVFKTGSLTDPANDPHILAVGASNSRGTMTVADDTVPSFSSTGSNSRYVDLVAPGAHIVSLRVPGSYIDRESGATGAVSDRLFRGSGTSEAAAFVSGAAALVIQQRPGISPDRLKKLFIDGAVGSSGYSSKQQGQGEIALKDLLTKDDPIVPKTWSKFQWSTGTGSLEASRGTDHLTIDGVVLSGERDIFGHAFDSAAMAALEADGNSWSGGTWNGNSWSGSSWSGNSWSGNSLVGQQLVGQQLVRQLVVRQLLVGNSWSGNSWSGNSGPATAGRATPGPPLPGSSRRSGHGRGSTLRGVSETVVTGRADAQHRADRTHRLRQVDGRALARRTSRCRRHRRRPGRARRRGAR